jgi:hypothetical protein
MEPLLGGGLWSRQLRAELYWQRSEEWDVKQPAGCRNLSFYSSVELVGLGTSVCLLF